MATLAHTNIVNLPSITAAWRRWPMVADRLPAGWRENARDILLLLAFVGPLTLYLTGFIAGNTVTAQAVTDIKAQLSVVQDHESRLRKIEAGVWRAFGAVAVIAAVAPPIAHRLWG